MQKLTGIVRYLEQDEKQRSRALYQHAFPEDTKRFVDFYYQYKTEDNQILVLEEEGSIVSMLHRNPYTMILNGYEFHADYLVAVATEKDHRHQGCMRRLLKRALNDMAAERMPFTFLMPASESIYAPFDFVWISPFTKVPERVRRMSADGQNRYLAVRYQMFCKRDGRYLENWKAEREAEAGEAMPEQIPPFMARITDVEQMLRLFSSKEAKTWHLKIRDPLIEKNQGWFRWEAAKEESQVHRLVQEPERIDLDMTIGELTAFLFEGRKICLSEVV